MQELNKGNTSRENIESEYDFFLDITGETCPMTFVRTKLMLEKMSKGQVAEVLLKGVEPLKNVPRSVEEHGDEILSLINEKGDDDPEVVHHLIIRRN